MENKPELAVVERGLLQNRFPKEAEQIIGLDGLTDYETKLLNKCIHHNPINDEEFSDLKRLLARYRDYLNKYEPDKVIENLETTKKQIKTEEDFLNLVENTVKELKINIPVNGEYYPAVLEILPVTKSNVVKTLEKHVDLFKDMNQEEILLYNEAQNGKELSIEEQAIINRLNERINELAVDNQMDRVMSFLASVTRLKGSNADYDTRYQFWEKFHFAALFAIYYRVEELLGLNESVTDKLFRDD